MTKKLSMFSIILLAVLIVSCSSEPEQTAPNYYNPLSINSYWIGTWKADSTNTTVIIKSDSVVITFPDKSTRTISVYDSSKEVSFDDSKLFFWFEDRRSFEIDAGRYLVLTKNGNFTIYGKLTKQ